MIDRLDRARVRGLVLLAIGLVAMFAVAACGGSSDNASTSSSSSASGGGSGGAGGGSGSGSGGGTSGSVALNLVGYSTPAKAYAVINQAYAATAGGKGVTFNTSFGPSGAQSRAVAAGQAADVVAFSTSSDISRLVKAGLVASSWDSGPTQGIVNDSVVVFVVRKGNPKHISSWADLTKPGIKVITPNPATSGSARWNIMAAYGAQLKLGASPTAALAYVKTLLTKNTISQPSSASSALQAFTSGQGDVLLDYESDALAAVKAGDNVQLVYPKQSILIETPVAVTSKTKHAAQADAYVKWLESPTAQALWAKAGYRPVLPAVAQQYASAFPTLPQQFTSSSLGGWSAVSAKFFTAPGGSIIKIEQAAGVPTASS